MATRLEDRDQPTPDPERGTRPVLPLDRAGQTEHEPLHVTLTHGPTVLPTPSVSI